MRLPFAALFAIGITVVAGCAGLNPNALQPGQSEAQVVAAMGQPTGRYSLAEGATRLEYARSGQTWMVDLDASGKVTQVAQVLTKDNFDQVRTGMNRQDLLRLLGRPSSVTAERGDRETLSWRYSIAECLWFQVTLTPESYVIYGRYVADSQCKGQI